MLVMVLIEDVSTLLILIEQGLSATFLPPTQARTTKQPKTTTSRTQTTERQGNDNIKQLLYLLSCHMEPVRCWRRGNNTINTAAVGNSIAHLGTQYISSYFTIIVVLIN